MMYFKIHELYGTLLPLKYIRLLYYVYSVEITHNDDISLRSYVSGSFYNIISKTRLLNAKTYMLSFKPNHNLECTSNPLVSNIESVSG